jgi:hypothetical protein
MYLSCYGCVCLELTMAVAGSVLTACLTGMSGSAEISCCLLVLFTLGEFAQWADTSCMPDDCMQGTDQSRIHPCVAFVQGTEQAKQRCLVAFAVVGLHVYVAAPAAAGAANGCLIHDGP